MFCKRAGLVLLGGLLVVVAGCAASQVTSFFFAAAPGELRFDNCTTVKEAEVVAKGTLTQAGFMLRDSPQDDAEILYGRLTIRGTTPAGKPFAIKLAQMDDGRGETYVKAKLDVGSGAHAEIRAVLPISEASKKDKTETDGKAETATKK